MATILFYPHPATGHYNASYGLAECLENKGHRIVYIGPDEFMEAILKKGWEFYLVDPSVIPFYFFECRKYGKLIAWFNNITERFSGIRRNQIMDRQEKVDSIIKKIKPDIILLDSFNIGEATYYHKFGVKLISYQSMVATNEDSFAPPFNYSFVPSESKLSALYVKFLWKKHILWMTYFQYYLKVWFFNQGYIAQLRKTAHQTGFPFDKEFDRNNCVSSGFLFKHIPELILSPPEFDFRKDIKPNHHLVGPIVHYKRDSDHGDSRFSKIINEIRLLKESSNHKIAFIYCSLGTNTFKELKIVHSFFQKIRHLCFRNKNIYVMLSIGSYYDTNRMGSIPSNLFVFKTVPQMEVLKHCDIMITHGGMNTVTECIINEVPMLVYPLVEKWDQPGNAARVVYHGLGLKGKIKRDSFTKMQSKLNLILQNYQCCKDNLKQMNSRFNLDYKKEYAVTVVEKYLKPDNYEHKTY